MAAAQVPSAMATSDDSMSDLSHSIEDSEPNASICSSNSSDDAAESSSLAEETMAKPVIEVATGLTSKVRPVPELNQQPARRSFVKREPEEMEPALELKMDEVDNNRHSATGLYSTWKFSPFITQARIAKDYLQYYKISFLQNTQMFSCTCWSTFNKKPLPLQTSPDPDLNTSTIISYDMTTII